MTDEQSKRLKELGFKKHMMPFSLPDYIKRYSRRSYIHLFVPALTKTYCICYDIPKSNRKASAELKEVLEMGIV